MEHWCIATVAYSVTTVLRYHNAGEYRDNLGYEIRRGKEMKEGENKARYYNKRAGQKWNWLKEREREQERKKKTGENFNIWVLNWNWETTVWLQIMNRNVGPIYYTRNLQSAWKVI